MDTRTGEIESMDKVMNMPIEQAKWFKEIPDKFLDRLQNMSRNERRTFYKQHKGEWIAALEVNSKMLDEICGFLVVNFGQTVGRTQKFMDSDDCKPNTIMKNLIIIFEKYNAIAESVAKAGE